MTGAIRPSDWIDTYKATAVDENADNTDRIGAANVDYIIAQLRK